MYTHALSSGKQMPQYLIQVWSPHPSTRCNSDTMSISLFVSLNVRPRQSWMAFVGTTLTPVADIEWSTDTSGDFDVPTATVVRLWHQKSIIRYKKSHKCGPKIYIDLKFNLQLLWTSNQKVAGVYLSLRVVVFYNQNTEMWSRPLDHSFVVYVIQEISTMWPSRVFFMLSICIWTVPCVLCVRNLWTAVSTTR